MRDDDAAYACAMLLRSCRRAADMLLFTLMPYLLQAICLLTSRYAFSPCAA